MWKWDKKKRQGAGGEGVALIVESQWKENPD